ncbi:hypothetical protein SAMN05877753_102730 [Bacillus oleivorans]|uniref:Integral inner membrane protein n=1 Tax=Bacillus oleivorans TaxID=1448271 RepID=A0A285CMQ7_9BACI|nr:hypothetical protein [Bacillus oleivorans]SNX68791.1 hypothetical protein SAMN05877753_102730 [Bacillus oleivorans]
MSFVGWLIIGCEIAFWVVIGLGLITRYIWNQKKFGLFLLALTPLIDLVLLIATSHDLINGATASLAHGLAAVYIAVSLVFGKSMIQWADLHFQYYILKQGTKPERLYGIQYAKHYFKGWLKHAISYVIGTALLILIIFLIDDSSRSEALSGIIKMWTLVLGIDLFISVTYFIAPRKARA